MVLEAVVPDTIFGERIWNETGEVEVGISHWMVLGAANDIM